MSISGQTIYDTICVQKRIYHNTILANLDRRTEYIHLTRKARSESVLTVQQRKCIVALYHSDESLSIDSTSKRMVEVNRGEEIELHVGRVWSASTVT